MSVTVLLIGIVLPWLIVALFVALGAWIGFQLIHQNGRLLARLESLEQRLVQLQAPSGLVPGTFPAAMEPAAFAPEPSLPAGLPIGSPAPEFELPDLNGERRSLADFRGKKLLLVFFNPGCGFCTQMAPDLASLPADGADGQPLPLVVSTGDPEENRLLVQEYGLRCPVLLQQGMEVASLYEAHGTPMGCLVDESGAIASPLAAGADALLALLNVPLPGTLGENGHSPVAANGNGHAALGGRRSLAESKLQRDGLPAGTPAPDFTLPRLDGGELSLSDLRGRKVLLVFSDPNCGPCDALAPQLEQLARRTPEVQVLMVSRGDVEANRVKVAEHGLTFPVVLQRQWEISRQYAMFATPVGYLLCEGGIIDADVAVGVEPILGLMSSETPGEPRERAGSRCRCGKPVGECGCGRHKARELGCSQRRR